MIAAIPLQHVAAELRRCIWGFRFCGGHDIDADGRPFRGFARATPRAV